MSTFEMYADWPRDAYFEIIGIIADAKNHGLQDPPRPEVYFSHTLTGTGPRMLMVRTAGNPDRVQASLHRELSALDPDVVISEAGSVESFLKRWYFAEPQFILIVLGTFAGIGLVLVTIGTFSVMAYTVSLRAQEIGIRMALGAQQKDILRMVLRKGLVLVTAGTLAGVATSLAVGRFIAGHIWGVSARDPWTCSAVVAVIVLVDLAACLLPARRATEVDPLLVLRSE